MRIFFATDLHGSEICFRKFCAAAEFYRCDALVLGGDLTGKMIVRVLTHGDELQYGLGGTVVRLDREQIDAVRRRIADMGYYAVAGAEDELAELDDPAVYEERLLEEAIARAHQWVAYAEEKVARLQHPILVAPGNDDHPALDAVFQNARAFTLAEQELVQLDGIDVITTGWSNPTPWHTPREASEDALLATLRAMVEKLRDPRRAIYNIHVPPHNTPLDVCPELDSEFRVVTMMGNPVMIHAGSTAVRRIIDETQPLVSLHGHIHESRNTVKLGRTLAINPGSEYGEGVLMGSIVTIKGDKVTQSFTAG